MIKPVFIAFEGIDGSGKTTQISKLYHRFQTENLKVHQTCEPTKLPTGKLIRSIFLGDFPADEHTIASLFLADRLEHLLNKQEGILKLLSENIHVISDRYYFSSYAYHSVHVPMDWVFELNKKCTELLRPTATIFIDVNPEVAYERILQRNENKELYETLGNLKKVYNNYLTSFEKTKATENILIIDGNQTEERVAELVWEEVQKCLIQNTY